MHYQYKLFYNVKTTKPIMSLKKEKKTNHVFNFKKVYNKNETF